ncbi:hypothetical protein F0562_003843 [Nyssa sinensis]|uniref:SCP domain-containing protein n=1 Tax=Nyssa sinensis TaxID=561372 RepID=A0A5J5BW04_9ASTE|nr:hypothetical protein F0562_003843 [Nyssa sinensis]
MAKFFLALVALAMCHSSAHSVQPPADATAPGAPPNATHDFLDAHNQARAEVGVGPLEWSEMLANATSLLVRYQRDKKGCGFAELTAGKYGGNQLWASGTTVTPRMAVDAWVAEKKYYNYANNSCAPDHQCGVYTQLVWRKSLELGCAQARCNKEQASLTIFVLLLAASVDSVHV